uniref:G_PROTEIN_RECEP_F1_2 domain-containing protein n=2 Tax=Globodera pallida TaxID=36090 RepID=A0A183CCX0_GLOPA
MPKGVSLCFSTLTLSAISIDRFRLIVTPLRQSIQKRCACRIVALNSAIALIISLPMLFTQKLDTYDRFCGQFCSEYWDGELGAVARSAYGTFVFFAQFVIPFLIISSCYVMISIKINSGVLIKRASTEITKFNDMSTSGSKITNLSDPRSAGRHSSVGTEECTLLLTTNGTNDAHSGTPGTNHANDVLQMAMEQKKAILNRRLRTNKMLIAMVALFFCCWAPTVLFNFLRDNQWLPKFVLSQEYLFGIITHCISMSSTIWNPVLYALLNEQFRAAFSEQFKQLRHRFCLPCRDSTNSGRNRLGTMDNNGSTSAAQQQQSCRGSIRLVSIPTPSLIKFEHSVVR